MSNIAARMLGLCVAAPALTLVATDVFAGQPAESHPLIQETAPAVGPQPRTCLPHDGVDSKLHDEFGEKVLGRGISKDGTLLEVFLAPAGTFTVIKTSPDGVSCVVDFGEGWQTLNQLESVGFTPGDLPDDLGSAQTPF